MPCFGQYRDQTINSFVPVSPSEVAPQYSQIATLGSGSETTVPSLAAASGIRISQQELSDQFLLFQLHGRTDGVGVIDTSQVEPAQSGSAEKPDALAVVKLVSFNVGTEEGIDKDTRATLRLDLGKDASSDSPLDTVFWSIAAGLNLYHDIENKRSEAADLETDFNEAFSRRPVEIPGALGNLSFEVIKHKEPKWWRKIFTFLRSGTGRALTSAVGFPGITGQAIGFLDELLNRLDRSNPEVLFKGRPMTLALTSRARDSYTGGVPSVRVGVMNPGFCLLARGRDYEQLATGDPVYMASYGLLKPKGMTMTEFLKTPSSNPFNRLTYAVLKVNTAEAKLRPMLD